MDRFYTPRNSPMFNTRNSPVPMFNFSHGTTFFRQEQSFQQSFQQFRPPGTRGSTSSSQESDLSHYINPDSEYAAQLLRPHPQYRLTSKQHGDNYKTVMCQNWLEKMHCSYGRNCRFAHGLEELREPTIPLATNANYKTRLCAKYVNTGICPYGSRCLYIHPPTENSIVPLNNGDGGSGSLAFPPMLSPAVDRQPIPLKSIQNQPTHGQGMGMALRGGSNSNHLPSLFNASLPAFSFHKMKMELPSAQQVETRPNQRPKLNLFPQPHDELHHENSDKQKVDSADPFSLEQIDWVFRMVDSPHGDRVSGSGQAPEKSTGRGSAPDQQ